MGKHFLPQGLRGEPERFLQLGKEAVCTSTGLVITPRDGNLHIAWELHAFNLSLSHHLLFKISLAEWPPPFITRYRIQIPKISHCLKGKKRHLHSIRGFVFLMATRKQENNCTSKLLLILMNPRCQKPDSLMHASDFTVKGLHCIQQFLPQI